MYSRERSVRESVDPRKGPPSFSSTLLDEIYRSIDDGSARESRSSERDRARKWLDMKRNKKSDVADLMKNKKTNTSPAKKLHFAVDNDALFFSSGSNSSDSNSSLFSEHESIPIPLPTAKAGSSCFLPPKPIRTGVKAEKTTGAKKEHDDDVPGSTSKSRALKKMYAHLKKMKQPISPGMKLTSFINSILPNSKSKRGGPLVGDERSTPKCSSAASFSRSYSSHCQQKPPEPNRVRTALNMNRDELRHHQSAKIELRKAAETRAAVEDEDASDCSEDLFEIDHLKLRFTMNSSGDLPVYETTAPRMNLSNQSRLTTTTVIKAGKFKV